MDVMSTSSSHHSHPIFSRKGVTTHKKRNMETCSNMFSLGIRTSSNYMWTYLIPTMSESGGSKILVTQKHVAFFWITDTQKVFLICIYIYIIYHFINISIVINMILHDSPITSTKTWVTWIIPFCWSPHQGSGCLNSLRICCRQLGSGGSTSSACNCAEKAADEHGLRTGTSRCFMKFIGISWDIWHTHIYIYNDIYNGYCPV